MNSKTIREEAMDKDYIDRQASGIRWFSLDR